MIETLELTDIFKPIRDELGELNAATQKSLKSSDSFQQVLNEHLLTYSGKQLRPSLTLLAAKFGQVDKDKLIKLAVACELLHTATLIHDDIVDGSTMRRNHASLNAKWGSDISLICGDIIYAKAFQILAEISSVQLNQLFANCVAQVCKGEMKQLEARGTFTWDETMYLDMIQNKTASLFETACLAGSLISSTDDTTTKSLSQLGLNLGMAYQIIDDCLDIVGSAEILGKDNGTDLSKNDPTLPMIYLAESLNGNSTKSLKLILGDSANQDKIKAIQDKIKSTGSLDKALAKATFYINEAKSFQKELPTNDYSVAISQLIDYIQSRITQKN